MLDFRPEGGGHVADRHAVVVRVDAAGVEATERASGKGIQWLTPASKICRSLSAVDEATVVFRCGDPILDRLVSLRG